MESENNIKERNLERICVETEVPAFSTNLVGTQYCMLRPSSHRIDCKYRCYSPDRNGLFPCMYEQLKVLEERKTLN